MTDHSILFQPNMVEALHAGRKTQTRRALKINGHRGFFQFGVSDTAGSNWEFRRKDHVWEDYTHKELLNLLPHQIGDRLWVKEAHWALGHWHETGELKKNGKPKWVFVRALGEPPRFAAPDHTSTFPRVTTFGWYKRNSLFHPKADSRTTLLITDVRVQRLQDISEADAVAEGACPIGTHWEDYANKANYFTTASASFKSLINSINGPDTWEQNPWVVAYSFEVEHQNIGRVEA
ncbi:MAG: hypothetical protein COB08_005645 [Rhodobacteraceae bacterium]|nr:hypothetical protein [Paracoccaceae bacterium]